MKFFLFLISFFYLLQDVQAQVHFANLRISENIADNMSPFEVLQKVNDPNYFTSFQNPNFYYANKAGFIWVAITTDHLTEKKNLLEFRSITDIVEMYYYSEGQLIKHQMAGQKMINHRLVKYKYSVFELPTQLKKNDIILLKVSTQSALAIPIIFWHHLDFAHQILEQTSIDFIYIGAMFMFVLLVLLFSLTSKSRLFISYAAFIFFGTLVLTTFDGSTYYLLNIFPIAVNPIKHHTLLIIFWLCRINAFVMFSKSFLDISHKNVTYLLITVVNAVALSALFFVESNYSIDIIAAILEFTISTFFLLYSAFIFKKKRNKTSLLFLFSWLIVFGFIVIHILRVLRILEGEVLPTHSMKIAGGLHLTILSIAVFWKYRDIEHENKQLQEERNRLKDVKTINSAILQTTEMLAHDIKRPFSLLHNLTRLIIDKRIDLHNQTFIDKFYSELQSTIKIVDSMLTDISDYAANKVSLNIQSQSPTLLLEKSINLFSTHEYRKKIFIEYSFSHTNNILIDDTKIMRVIANIIANAEKELNDNGRIWFHTSQKELNGKCFLHLTIGNNGPQIAREDLKLIFKPYFTKSKKRGIGLGLAICQKMIEIHHGVLTCKNTPQGVEFEFTLPADIKNLDTFKLKELPNML